MKTALETAQQQIKTESIKLGICFIALFAALWIAFYKESPFVTFKVAASLFFLFALPGYLILSNWKENIDFLEKLIGGSLISSALFIAMTYYSGLAGLNVKYSTWIAPIILYLIGFAIIFIQHKKKVHHGKV